MKHKQKVEVCYNVQTTVDERHKLILDHDVTNETSDQNQLYKMAKQAKNILEVDRLEVLADKGYYNTEDVKKCTDIGIIPYVSEPKNQEGRPFFQKEEFTHIEEKDIYVCPQDHRLVFQHERADHNRTVRVYKGEKCTECKLKSKCTKSRYRTIQRFVYEPIIEEMRKRVLKNQDKMGLRKTLSEHPFGTIKCSFNQGYMLMRGLEKVRAEISLSVLAYNIKRAINVVGAKNLIAALG